jgi:protoporphyrinogen oxidase
MGKTIVLGAGLAGLSASYHLGHQNCLLLERAARPFGHIGSTFRAGFTWDEGPHVSFTKHEYVRSLFADSVQGEFVEFATRIGNYFRGQWIDHPAQVSLHQVPEPLRAQCLESFLASRRNIPDHQAKPADYQDWLERAFGRVFADTFPAAYTRKYWTRPPRDLTTGWIGERVLYPSVEDVRAGAKAPLGRNANYITTVRYPRRGGYSSFAQKLRDGADIRFGAQLEAVNLPAREIRLTDGTRLPYEKLVSTLPLPEFIRLCEAAPPPVAEAARALSCTELLLVNVIAQHPSRRPETWLYVYDEDKLATRISFTERLTSGNAPAGWTGVQTEIYASRHRPFPGTEEEMAGRVRQELAEMGLVDAEAEATAHTVRVPWANVVFDHDTAPALGIIWSWLEQFGLRRDADDLNPLTNWDRASATTEAPGDLAFAGRYGQWKYFWTDDCVLRGRQLAAHLS